MESYNILSALLTVPLAGALLSWLMPKGLQRIYGIFGSILILSLTIYTLLLAGVESMEVKLPWLPEIGLAIHLKLDKVSKWFVLLNAFVALVAFGLKGVWYRKYPRLFTSFGFFLVFALNAAFLSNDLILFYLAYEAVFIPMIFFVGIWGENRKATSVFRFFFMSFLGSILMFVSMFALISIYHGQSGEYSSNVSDLLPIAGKTGPETLWCFLGFFLAFAIKVPLFPFHGWLKEVYCNAPMPATIWMSAILSKLGIFGLIRFAVPLFFETAQSYQGVLMVLAAVSILYSAFLAIRASDPKELLAYSSMSHLGFVLLGVFSFEAEGYSAAILLSIGHTLVSAMLFYILHLIQERREHLDLEKSYGFAKSYPVLAILFFFGVLASVSLPGTLNFAGEFLVLMQAFPKSPIATTFGALGAIFGAVYMLKFFQQVNYSVDKKANPASSPDVVRDTTKDLVGYDLILLSLMVIAILYFGFQPMLFLKGI